MTDEFFSGVDKAVEALNLGGNGQRLQELLRLSHELMTALDVGQALVAAGEAVRQVCDAERFVVLLTDAEGTLVARAARNAAGVDLPLPAPVFAEACEHARMGDIAHVQQPRWQRGALAGFVAVPMLGAHGCVGVIYADGETRFAQRLDAHAQEMLTLLAGHAAMAVQNAQLMARVQAGAPETRAQFERRLHDELKRAQRYGRPFSVIYADVVDADVLIRRYDTAAVDELMQAVSRELGALARTSDALARIGPARIALIMPEPQDDLGDTHGLRGLTERLRARLASAAFHVRGTPQKVRVLAGGVSYQQPPLLGIKGVLHEIELAMEVARRDGRDHFVTR